MKSILRSGLLALALAGCCQGAELLKNSAFETGDPARAAHWRVQPVGSSGGSVRFENGCAVLTNRPSDSGVILIQEALPLRTDAEYELSFEGRAGRGVPFRAFVEYVSASGKYDGFYHNFEGAGEWTGYRFVISRLPKEPAKVLPYLGFALRVPGPLEIRNPRLRLYAEIRNADFENGAADGWTLASAGVEPFEKSKVLALAGTAGKAVYHDIVLKPDTRYQLSYDVCGIENRTSENGFSRFRVSLASDGASLIPVGEWADCFQNQWQRKEHVFRTPAGMRTAATMLCESGSDGKLLLDNFVLRELGKQDEPKVRISVSSPFYRDTIFAGDPVEVVAGMVTLAPEVHSVVLSFAGQKAVLGGGMRNFSFPAAALAVGEYPLMAKALDKAGKEIGSTRSLIRKLPPSPSEVIIKSDRNLYVNGKIFFLQRANEIPLLGQSSAAEYMAQRSGLSVARWQGTPPEEARTLQSLNMAQAAGLHELLVLPIHMVYAGNKTPEAFRAAWRKWIDSLTPSIRNHPALLGYYLFDEPLWNGIPLEIVRSAYEMLREKDPYHPILACEAPRGTVEEWRPYARYCDIFGIDIYPLPAGARHSGLPDQSMTSVGAYTRMAHEAIGGGQTVWMILQAFSWGVFNRQDVWSYPDREQMRFMYYDALLHGAKALGYFNLMIHDKDFYREWYGTVCEVNRMAGVFLAGKALPLTVSPSASPVKAEYREYDNGRWLVAINRSPESCDAVFDTGAGAPAQWHVLGEKRTVTATDGRFADRFAPYGVHVYGSVPDYPRPLSDSAFDAGKEVLLEPYFEKISVTGRALKSSAFWIWSPDSVGVANGRCFVTRSFEVKPGLKSAVLHVTADDTFSGYLNGVLRFSGESWARMTRNEIAGQLRPGTNLLAFEARNHTGACGILVDLKLDYGNGAVEHIVSDRSWRTASAPDSDDWNRKGLTGGAAARELFPFGKGPWNF